MRSRICLSLLPCGWEGLSKPVLPPPHVEWSEIPGCIMAAGPSPRSSALDAIREALHLLDSVPESPESQDQLLDDRAQALLWLYICSLESKMQQVRDRWRCGGCSPLHTRGCAQDVQVCPVFLQCLGVPFSGAHFSPFLAQGADSCWQESVLALLHQHAVTAVASKHACRALRRSREPGPRAKRTWRTLNPMTSTMKTSSRTTSSCTTASPSTWRPRLVRPLREGLLGHCRNSAWAELLALWPVRDVLDWVTGGMCCSTTTPWGRAVHSALPSEEDLRVMSGWGTSAWPHSTHWALPGPTPPHTHLFMASGGR